MILLVIFVIFCIVCLNINFKKDKITESFSINNANGALSRGILRKQVSYPLDIFHSTLLQNSNIKIIDIKKSINYDNREITGFKGGNIYYKLLNRLDNNIYIILRYPDFINEIKRHSLEYMMNYFTYMKSNIIKKDDHPYIFDFTGYHGIIDNKVGLWIKISEKYGRNIANEIMGITYLCPNDKEIFLSEYKPTEKYILKNSFGGARSALTITRSKNEILSHFYNNLKYNFNPITCKDAVCHSKVKYNIIQKFIEPTLLIGGYKFGLRMYLIIICKEAKLNAYIFKNGYCYYTKSKYNKNSSELYDNVVGTLTHTENMIRTNNMPLTYKEFEKYVRMNMINGMNKIDNFVKKLKKYCKYIVNVNINNLCIFENTSFSIYALDIDVDKNLKPYIFEGNYYFGRFNSNKKLGGIISNMYNDIYYKIGLSNKEYDGFWQL